MGELVSEKPTDRGSFTGDRMSAFVSLWEASRPAVLGYITAAVVQYHDAQDIVQETAIAAASSYNRFDPTRPFLPWVLGIARHQILKHHERCGRARVLLVSDQALRAAEDVILAMSSRVNPRIEALQQCLKLEHGRRRQVIAMRYAEEMPVTQISAKLGMTPGAVVALLHRVRRSLADCISQRIKAIGDDA
jgi:RNA polymerase sigma-70 factor (ECF subfamily)